MDDVSFSVFSGETVALVGESGCGKSLTALAVMRLNDSSYIRESGTIEFEGKDVTQLTGRELHSYRGGEAAMIFQEPMTALNPVIRCGAQIKEVLTQHGIGTVSYTHLTLPTKRIV